MKIYTYLTPVFTENKNSFMNSLTVYIDVLRASTTICTALSNGAREVIPAETMDRALSVYSNLSSDIRILAGEREGLKPNGFQLGNSPREFSEELVSGKSIVLTTSNGTRAVHVGKNSKLRLVASFVNISSIIEFISNESKKNSFDNINIICSGNNGNFSFEDTLCAGLIIRLLNKQKVISEKSDASVAALELYNSKHEILLEFLRDCEHPKYLISIGSEQDVLDSLTINKYDIVPVVTGNIIKAFNKNTGNE